MSVAASTNRPPSRIRAIMMGTLVTVAAGSYLYRTRVRPALQDWGATPTEAAATLDGDDRIARPDWRRTNVVDIDAPPPDVWPWLVQMGHQRGGWYAYGRSAVRILPEHQTLHTDDLIPLGARPGFGLRVVETEQDRRLVLGWSGRPADAAASSPRVLWAYHLVPRGTHGTRLILRLIGRGPHPWAHNKPGPLSDHLAPIMQRKHLLGVKVRAERLYRIHKARWKRAGTEVTPSRT